MNLQALREEVQARGFDSITDARVDRWVNVAVTEIVETADWPFLVSTAIGTAPLTISDLRTVESVEADDRKLEPADRRTLTDRFPDLAQEGDPTFYYLSSDDTVSTYPLTTGTLRVRYWRAATELVNNTDVPPIPARYHYAIVDYAVARGYEDSDEPQMAQSARQSGDRLLLAMTASLLHGQHDRPARMVNTGGHWDG